MNNCTKCDDSGWFSPGPNNEPRCPKCRNSMQNGIPEDAPHMRRCATCKLVWTPEPCYNCEMGKLRNEVILYEAMKDGVAERIRLLEMEVKQLRVKCNNSLANNLCPDHRDKQKDKPCLACEIEQINKLFDGRAKGFAEHLQNRAKELVPDFPYSQEATAFEYLWALTSSLEGTEMARKDWEAYACQLEEKIITDTTLGELPSDNERFNKLRLMLRDKYFKRQE